MFMYKIRKLDNTGQKKDDWLYYSIHTFLIQINATF